MTIYRWCGFARKVRDYRMYRLLGYWALLEIPIVLLMAVFTIVLSLTKSTAIQKVLFFANTFVFNPTLCLMAFAFFLTALHFLRKMRRLALQQDALHSLRKMTIVSIVGFFLVATITVVPILYAMHVIQTNLGYLLTLLDLTFFWMLYHSLVFYLLSVRLPKAESGHGTAVGSHQDAPSERTKSTEHIGLSSIHVEEQDSPSAVWNAVVLQGLVPTDRRPYRLPSMERSTSTDYGMTTSQLSLREFTNTSPATLIPSVSVPSPSVPAEMSHYFQTKFNT
jgi:hypothetical protein